MGRIPQGVSGDFIDKGEAADNGWALEVVDCWEQEGQYGPNIVYSCMRDGEAALFSIKSSGARQEQARVIKGILLEDGAAPLYIRLARKGRAYDIEEIENPELPF